MVHRIEILNTNPAMRRTIPRRIMAVTSFYSDVEVAGPISQCLPMPPLDPTCSVSGHDVMVVPAMPSDAET